MNTFFAKKELLEKDWFLVDAENLVLGQACLRDS